MSLTLDARLTDRDFDVCIEVRAGETLAVLGPNGAGKSTLLGLVAGLLVPTDGSAHLDGTRLFEVSAGRRRIAEPRRRGISLLAQEPLLFPHLTALENIAFGPRSRGVGRRAARATATHWLERVGLDTLGGRRPAQLSGGQAQRVALARALAADPALLLLDEPFAALDVTVAPALRHLLQEVLAERSALIVTHDPLDAHLLADRVLVLERGRVVETGTTREVLTRPATSFGARLAGLTLVPGTRDSRGFVGDDGIRLPTTAGTVGERLVLAVRPAAVRVARTSDREPGIDAGCTWVGGRIEDVQHRGDVVRVQAAGLTADLAPAAAVDLGVVLGLDVLLGIRHDDAVIYPSTPRPPGA